MKREWSKLKKAIEVGDRCDPTDCDCNSAVKDVFWCTPGGPQLLRLSGSIMTGDMKAEDLHPLIGVVVCEDQITGQRRGYIGIGLGQDEKADIEYIRDWGSPVNDAFMEQMAQALKKKAERGNRVENSG